MNAKVKQTLSLILIVTVSLSIMLLLISLKNPPKRKPIQDNRPTINTVSVINKPLQIQIPVIGRLTAHERVEILAEVSGVLEYNAPEFLAGQTFSKGEIMLTINQEETAFNLKAQRSNLLTAIAALLPELKFDYPESYQNWDHYLQEFNIDSTTTPLPAARNAREKYFVATRGIDNKYYQIKAQETRLAKFTIRAPFDGVLTQSNITPGNLVRAGQPLGVFINPSSYDLATTVSMADVALIQVGDKATLHNDIIAGSWQGRVSRINSNLDPNNQMVQVFIVLQATELRANMFLQGQIATTTTVQGMALPRKMLYNGDTVLEIRAGQIHYLPVKVVFTSGSTAIVTGLPDGLVLSTRTQNLPDGTTVNSFPKKSQNTPQSLKNTAEQA